MFLSKSVFHMYTRRRKMLILLIFEVMKVASINGNLITFEYNYYRYI